MEEMAVLEMAVTARQEAEAQEAQARPRADVVEPGQMWY
jgi:hypothetical protein